MHLRVRAQDHLDRHHRTAQHHRPGPDLHAAGEHRPRVHHGRMAVIGQGEALDHRRPRRRVAEGDHDRPVGRELADDGQTGHGPLGPIVDEPEDVDAGLHAGVVDLPPHAARPQQPGGPHASAATRQAHRISGICNGRRSHAPHPSAVRGGSPSSSAICQFAG